MTHYFVSSYEDFDDGMEYEAVFESLEKAEDFIEKIRAIEDETGGVYRGYFHVVEIDIKFTTPGESEEMLHRYRWKRRGINLL